MSLVCTPGPASSSPGPGRGTPGARPRAAWRPLAAAAALAVFHAGCAGGSRRPAPAHPVAVPGNASRFVIAGYLGSWGIRTRGVRIATLPAERLTHLLYAFGGVSADGRAVLGDPCLDVGDCGAGHGRVGGAFDALRALKAVHPHLRTLIAIGGWTGSRHFSDAAATPAARSAFAASAIEVFFRRAPGVFDGIDIDWEFPVAGGLPDNRYRPEDRRNLTLLLAELRLHLDAEGTRTGRRYLLTIAASARPHEMANVELAEAAAIVDWINVMAYDYHSVDTIAHFNAPLYPARDDPSPAMNVHATVQGYLAAGVPRHQVVVGAPFYGRGYGGVAPDGDGVFQRGSRGSAGEWGGDAVDYRTLVAMRPAARGFRRLWHPEAMVPWLYNRATGVWVSFDDPRSVALKAEYARAQGLGGIMFWELGGDDGTLLAAIHEQLAPDAPAPHAASVSEWVEHTLATLSLREKVGQMIMPQLPGGFAALDSPELERLAGWVQDEGVGGFVASIGMPLSYAAKLNELQRRARVPLLVASDMESGPGMRLAGIYSVPRLLPQGGGTSFPPAMALGAAGSDTLAFEVGRVVAREARAVGVHMAFGPVLDVNSNPSNPIINVRSFGEDPSSVARLGAAFIRGARSGGLLTAAKHFPGHGDTETDTHLDLPVLRVSRARLDSIELRPYHTAVAAGVDAVMTAHIAIVGVEGEAAPPATMSAELLAGVLRRELRFQGLIFTDAMNMGAIVRRYGTTEPLVEAVAAGADVVLMPVDVHDAVETLVAAVRSGRLSEARIDASVRRILEAKFRAGLAARRLVDLDAVDAWVGTRAHADLAGQVAARSLTLARDDRGLVPLPGSARRLLAVTYAPGEDLVAGRRFAAALAEADPRRRVDAARVDVRTSPAEYAALRILADSADVVVAAAFVAPLEFSGSIVAGGGFPGFVQQLAAAGKPVIAVSFGSPYLLQAFPGVPAYLLAWGDAEASQDAAARALHGLVPITGTLPVSLPPLFARGQGLARTPRPGSSTIGIQRP